MANIVVTYLVQCVIKNGVNKGKVHSMTTPDLQKAVEAFNKSVAMDYQSRLAIRIGDKLEVTSDAYNWDISCYNKTQENEFRQKVKNILTTGTKLTQPQVEALLSLDNKDIRNIVCANNVERLTELKGIGDKSAKRIIRALRNICKPANVRVGKSKEFVRLQLNNDRRTNDLYTIDTINKTVSPVEAMAMELGGKDAVIHVVSMINTDGVKDEGRMIRAEKLQELWNDFCENGIVLNGYKYRLFGHGTNAAKWCKTIAVREDIYDQMRDYTNGGISPNWKNTAAKDIAYTVGLAAVYSHRINIPFKPEEFCIYNTVETNVVANTTKLHLDGHAEDRDNDTPAVKWSDGLFFISVSPRMKVTLYNRMVDLGMDPDVVQQTLDEFCNDTSFASYRGNPAKLKGLGVKNITVQDYWHSKGIHKTPDGRSIDDVVFFVDETVIKTTIGEGKAYPTFEAWCKAMGDQVFIGSLVKAHAKSRKDVSYQVLQSLCEADNDTIEKMGVKTADRVNELHTVKGAAKLLGREWGKIMELYPELANERTFAEQIAHDMRVMRDEAFSGKLLHCSWYAFVMPDPFFVLDAWAGLKPEGMFKAGEAHVATIKAEYLGMWRSPVMHPNSVRKVHNVAIPEKFRKFVKHDEFVIMLNCRDDIPLAMDMDFDGDHANVTDDEDIIHAIEETLKIWNRLIIWETPKPEKKFIDEKELVEYFKGLTHINELGLTVYGLNALLNGISREKDEITGYTYYKRVPVSRRGVDFKKFAANVLVDASKHGGAEIEEPEESSQCSHMEQPWAKTYQDAVDRKMFWYVKYEGEKAFFEFETTAWAFYNEQRYIIEADADGVPYEDENGNVIKIDRFALPKSDIRHLDSWKLKEPVDFLNELADPKRLNDIMCYKTLNKLFAVYAKTIRRDVDIDDKPEGKFDFHKIMFNPAEGFRGLNGLVRKGEMMMITVNGEKYPPDQGLLNSLARRLERDRAIYLADDSVKDKENNSFEMTWRANALAELEAFAEIHGKTLRDVHDVCTWQMFKYCELNYSTMDGKLDFLRDQLWRAYRLIFGGMALEAAEENDSAALMESDLDKELAID